MSDSDKSSTVLEKKLKDLVKDHPNDFIKFIVQTQEKSNFKSFICRMNDPEDYQEHQSMQIPIKQLYGVIRKISKGKLDVSFNRWVVPRCKDWDKKSNTIKSNIHQFITPCEHALDAFEVLQFLSNKVPAYIYYRRIKICQFDLVEYKEEDLKMGFRAKLWLQKTSDVFHTEGSSGSRYYSSESIEDVEEQSNKRYDIYQSNGKNVYSQKRKSNNLTIVLTVEIQG